MSSRKHTLQKGGEGFTRSSLPHSPCKIQAIRLQDIKSEEFSGRICKLATLQSIARL